MGDATVPATSQITLSTILGDAAPTLRAYRPETVVAGKLHAIAHLGLANTRLKDFYELVALAHTSSTLRGAIEATFARRGADLPTSVPPGLTAEYASQNRQRQWAALQDRNDLELRVDLGEAQGIIRDFVDAVVWER